MKRIYLSLNKLDLGYLLETNSGFEFVADEETVKKAEIENAIGMLMFKLNKSGVKSYSKIPEPFSRFLNLRNDLIEKVKITDKDSQFEKLYKLAGLDMMNINFKIHQ